MHFINLEMRLAIKLKDELTIPLSPCCMLKDKKTIYIIGGVDSEKHKHKDMFWKVKIAM